MISVARGQGEIEGKAHFRPGVAPAQSTNGPGVLDTARQELVESHLPLVRAMARRYARGREELDDLVQAGSVGLVKASRRFDPTRGVAFATFVAPTVEGEIRRHLHDRHGAVRVPREAQRMSAELRRYRSELAASLGRAPDVRELAAALDADPREVERLLAADLARDPIALGAPGTDGPVDGEAPDRSEYRVLIASGLRALTPRERRIVFLRFHADMTERQIARTIGISQAHVSRLLEGALTKLRAELTKPADPVQAGDSTETAVISANPSPEAGGAEAEETEAEPGQAAASGRGRSKQRTPNGYSGRILVRMPSELHAQLALAAEREDVSLNRYVNDALSSSVDGSPAQPQEAAEETDGTWSRRISSRALNLALATNVAIVVLAGIAAAVLLVLALQRGL